MAPAPDVVASTVRAAALLLKPCQRPQDRSFSARRGTFGAVICRNTIPYTILDTITRSEV